MGMTLAEKILARASGRASVVAGPDRGGATSISPCRTRTPTWCARASRRSASARVWDPEKIVIILDHRVPAESEKTATTHKAIREFVARAGHPQFLRRRPRRHLPPGAGRERARPARHGGGRHRLAHHHARRVRRLRHRHRRHRDGRRLDRGQALVQGAVHHPHRGDGRVPAVDLGQGPDPLHHRHSSAPTAPTTARSSSTGPRSAA